MLPSPPGDRGRKYLDVGAAERSGESRDVVADLLMHGGVADDAALGMLSRAASNCGLISASRCIGAAASDNATGSTAFSEMKLTSMTTMSGRAGKPLALERADIGLFHGNDFGMIAQGGMQLPVPDVDREYHAGAVGEQDFREAAGRGADVEADVILDIDRILLQRARELDAAARDEGMRRLRLQHRVGGDRLGSLQHLFVVGRNEAGLDRGARASPAFEQPALDQQQIDALREDGMGAQSKDQEAEVSRAAAMATQASNAVESCQISAGFSSRQHQRRAVEIERVDHHQIVVMAEIFNGRAHRYRSRRPSRAVTFVNRRTRSA